MSRDINPFGLRMPSALKSRLEQSAQDNKRSINAEIVGRLERSFEGDELGFSGDLIDVLSLHAMLTSSFAKILDRSKLSEQENEMLSRLEGVADRVVSRTYFRKNGTGAVGVSGAETS